MGSTFSVAPSGQSHGLDLHLDGAGDSGIPACPIYATIQSITDEIY